MPRPLKPARLWLEPASVDAAGRVTVKSQWVILDRGTKTRTGCGPQDLGQAEGKLTDYLSEKRDPAANRDHDPRRVPIADIVNLYCREVAPRHARPNETINRLNRLLDHFGDKTLAELTPRAVTEYLSVRDSSAGARRELEDLRAAIGRYHKPFIAAFPIEMPEPGVGRQRALTRGEAARLLWAAWRMRQHYGDLNRRRTGQHIARFILAALYTGSRAGAVCAAAIRPTIGHGGGFVDLDEGIFYRRPPGERETKKRKPPIRLPDRLLAHMRRWERLGIADKFVVEWNGKPVIKINKAFRTARNLAGLGEDVVPHVLRHTGATWALQNRGDKWETAGFLGMTMETLERRYGHHHPDHQESARAAITGKKLERNPRTKTEHSVPKKRKNA